MTICLISNHVELQFNLFIELLIYDFFPLSSFSINSDQRCIMFLDHSNYKYNNDVCFVNGLIYLRAQLYRKCSQSNPITVLDIFIAFNIFGEIYYSDKLILLWVVDV